MRSHLKNFRSHGKYKAQCVANRDIVLGKRDISVCSYTCTVKT